jgi:hypothetical protein
MATWSKLLPGHPLTEQDQRRRHGRRLQLGLTQGQRTEDQPVDQVRADPGQRALLPVLQAVGLVDEHRAAPVRRHADDGGGHLGEVRARRAAAAPRR